jgi:hypothetical protein
MTHINKLALTTRARGASQGELAPVSGLLLEAEQDDRRS